MQLTYDILCHRSYAVGEFPGYSPLLHQFR